MTPKARGGWRLSYLILVPICIQVHRQNVYELEVERFLKTGSSGGFDEIDPGIESRLLESDRAAFGLEPATFGIEVFDLGSEPGVELFAGVVAGDFDFANLSLDCRELGLVAAEVDARGVDFFQNF